MARSRMASVDDPSHIRKYQPGGTFQSASRIVKARGFAGLYSGFHLHFSRFLPTWWVVCASYVKQSKLMLMCTSPWYAGDSHVFHGMYHPFSSLGLPPLEIDCEKFQFYEGGKHLFASSDGAGPLAIAASGGLCGLLSWVLVIITFALYISVPHTENEILILWKIYPIDSAKAIYQRDVLTHRPGEPLPKRALRFFNRRM